MLGFSRPSKYLPSVEMLQNRSDVEALLESICNNDTTYDWPEQDLIALFEQAKNLGISDTDHRGLALVKTELDRRTGHKRNEAYAAEQESLQVRRSPLAYIRDIGLGIRNGIGSLLQRAKDDLRPSRNTRRKFRQHTLSTQVVRLEELLYLSGNPIAVEVGALAAEMTQEAPQQQFQTITESTVLASQETGSSLALSQATNHFFGDPITLNDGESIEAHAQFTVLADSMGDRFSIAGSRAADGRNQLQDATIVEFLRNGSGYMYLKHPSGEEWKVPFSMDTVDTGSVIDMRMTYDGVVINVTLHENGKEIGSASAVAPKNYDTFSIGVSNIKWDRTDATDTMQNFSLVKHVTTQVPVPQEPAAATVEQTTQNVASLNGNADLGGVTIESSSAAAEAQSTYSLSSINRVNADIATKHSAIDAIDADIAAARQEMQEANDLLVQSGSVLTRWNERQSLESQQVTPTITVETKRLNRFLYVNYTDMPAGHYLTMSGPRVDASDAQYALHEGNGTVKFRLPRFGAANRATVELRGPDGNVVTDLHTFNHTKDAASKTGAGTSQTRVTKLAHAPVVPPELRVTDAERMQAIIDGVAAHATISECEESIAALEARKADLINEIRTLEQRSIGAAMLYATSENTRNSDGPENGLLHVTFSSPYAQTYFEVTIDNDPGAGYSGTVAHPAGTRNNAFTLNVTGLSGSNGNGGVHIRMYEDSTKADLLDSFDAAYDRSRREVYGETARDEAAFRNGIRIDEHGNGDTAYLSIPGLSGSVLMQSWDTDAAAGNMEYGLTEGVASFTAEGTLSSLDFSGTEGTVTDVYADLDIPEGVTVRATIFRGGLEIGTMELTQGMPLLFSDEGGFSAILFHTEQPSALTLRELLLQTNPEELFSAEILSRAENMQLARELATQDFGEIRDILVYPRFEHVLGDNNIYNHRGGAGGANGNAYFLLGYGGGTYDTYTLYKPDTTGSGAALGEVRYLNDEGFHVLPQEYYTLVNGALIVHPGAPKNIAVQIASGSGVTAYQAGTAQDIDLLVNAQTDFHPDVSVQHLVNGPTSYTGFSNGFNEIGQVSRPVIAAGETFHAVSLIYNNSGVSGQITVEVFTGDDNALIAGDSYTGTIGAYQRAQFVANATSPANATGLPSVRFRVTLPDGTQYWSGGMRSAEAEAAPGEGRGARISWVRGMMETIADQHGVDSTQFRASLANMQRIYGSDVVTTAMRQTNVAGGGGQVLSDNMVQGEGFNITDSNNQQLIFGQQISNLLNNQNISNTILENIENAPDNKNTMIIVIYGSNQFPGDGSGFDTLMESIRTDYAESWAFSPGNNPFELVRGVLPETAQQEIQEFIQSRLQNNPNIKNLALIGYSWGGGMTFEISKWIDENQIPVQIIGNVYVDSVMLNQPAGESRMPIGTHAMLNIYQSKTYASEDTPVELNGSIVFNNQGITDFKQIDLDKDENQYSHMTIDDNNSQAIKLTLEFIRNHIHITQE